MLTSPTSLTEAEKKAAIQRCEDMIAKNPLAAVRYVSYTHPYQSSLFDAQGKPVVQLPPIDPSSRVFNTFLEHASTQDLLLYQNKILGEPFKFNFDPNNRRTHGYTPLELAFINTASASEIADFLIESCRPFVDVNEPIFQAFKNKSESSDVLKYSIGIDEPIDLTTEVGRALNESLLYQGFDSYRPYADHFLGGKFEKGSDLELYFFNSATPQEALAYCTQYNMPIENFPRMLRLMRRSEFWDDYKQHFNITE